MDPFEELVSRAFAHSGGEGIHPTAVSGLQIVRSDRTTLPMCNLYTPSLCLVVQGGKEAVVGGQLLAFGAGEYLVTSVDLPATGRITQASGERPFLCLVMDLDPVIIYGILQDLDPAPAAGKTSGVFVDRADPLLLDAVLRLLRSLDHPGDARILAPLAKREISYRLLQSPYGPSVRLLGVAGSRTQRIAKAVHWIRSHFDQPMKIEDLALQANMSPSAFFTHFKQVTRLSPLQYQKALRLQEARRLLGTEIGDAATAAYRVGYESASQFSREYARAFGLPPMMDVGRMRAGASGQSQPGATSSGGQWLGIATSSALT